jgi:hypothetical protein
MRLVLATCLLFAAAGLLAAEGPPPEVILAPGKDRTLVNPACSHCKDEAKRRKGELRKEDRVLCWIRGKYDGGAIPFRFFFHTYPVISDTYGVFVRDADAGFARGFAPSLDFTFHGWRNGVLVMRHKDGTLYSALSGRAFAGKRKGERLEPVPTVLSDWGWWVEHYPDTVAYHLFAKYKPAPAPGPSPESRKTRPKPDPRLPAEEPVLGAWLGKSARAYPLAALRKKGVLHDKVGPLDLVAFYHEPTRAAAAYEPVASPPTPGGPPRPLTFAPAGKGEAAGFKDKETESSWDVAGRCVAGPLKGWTLRWIDAVEVKWYAWAAEYPETTIHK